MKYLPLMTDDEARYICSVIPQKHAISYFQHNPKEFAKILPGFRPNSIARFYADGDLLFKNRNRDFISSFIEDHINKWISQIQTHIEQCLEDGDNRVSAYINTLAQSFFVDNIALYFKLTEQDYSDEYLSLLSSAVKDVKKAFEEQKSQATTINEKNTDIEQLQSKLSATTLDAKNSNTKLSKSISEIKTLKKELASLEKLHITVQNRDKTIADLKVTIQKLEESKKKLRAELSAMQDNMQHLEAQIRDDIEKQQAAKAKNNSAMPKPLRPKDMAEFNDYLGYNLEDIGLSNRAEYFLLLKTHLSDILFQGVPILLNQSVSAPLMKCVANVLTGNVNFATLTYHKGISESDIDFFLSGSERIACLENFIGYYDEVELISMLGRHRNKIIFMTVAYDRTLNYIPYEFFKYCNYLNLNRIQAFSADIELTEDPSVCEEVESEVQIATPDFRCSPLLKEMLDEFGICQSLTAHKCMKVYNEQDLCRMLAFDIVPFCTDVLQIKPFNTSQKFVKYAGDMGRCSYKNLFREWFA